MAAEETPSFFVFFFFLGGGTLHIFTSILKVLEVRDLDIDTIQDRCSP